MSLNTALYADCPNNTPTYALARFSCFSRLLSHAMISPSSGARLFGGRQHTTFNIIASERSKPALPRHLFNSRPLGPTNGSPCSSSCLPGPSPTSTTLHLVLPVHGTGAVHVSRSLQFVQSRIFSRSFCSRCNRANRRRASGVFAFFAAFR